METDHRSMMVAFLRLPVELQELVNEHYCHDYFAVEMIDRPEDTPIQPPMTFVSRTVRERAVPIYYASYRLPMFFIVSCNFGRLAEVRN